jgi:hypothetical protein
MSTDDQNDLRNIRESLDAATRRVGDLMNPTPGNEQGCVNSEARRLFDDVLSRAIPEVRDRRVGVYTFAFYHDHESAAVSVCVDTEASSARLVLSQNAFRIRHFAEAVSRGDLRKAVMWKANIGRSLSLGDFELVNVARAKMGGIAPDDSFYLEMIRALRSREREIVPLASDPQRLLFCSSSAGAEVGYVWSADLTA